MLERAAHDVSDEPRDDHGRWTDGGGGSGDGGKHPGTGYSKHAYVDSKGVIHTSNVYDAQRALFENRKVELKQVKQVSTLIKRLGETAAEMAEQGEAAPVFNLCNVSVEGTNLFCAEHKGIPRVQMPVIPAKRTKDFIKYLKTEGYEVEKDNERAANLRSTQSEIDGAKVAVQMERIRKEGFYKRLVISRDDYILDGHHTWSGQLGIDAQDNSLKDDKSVKVARVNIGIIDLVKLADKWTAAEGIAKKPVSQAASYTHISLRQAEQLLDAETYARFADVAHRFFAANGELDGIDEVMITVPVGSVARAREREDTEIELWPEEDESEDDFMDRCVSELTVCIGDRAGSVCEDKWESSKELGKKGYVTLSMLSGDLAIAPCGTSCLGCRGDDTKDWDESKHPRVPAGSSEGGQFGEGGGGGGESTSGGSNYGLVPGDVEKFKALKGQWAKINNELLEHVDDPDGPECRARLDQLEAICKEMHGLHADPGDPSGIGLPGGPRDVVVVGAGPGGLTASINGAAEGLDTLVIEAQAVAGGQAKFSSRIENFPGFPVGVTGERLTQDMFTQAQRLGAEAKLGIRVTGMTYDASTGLKHIKLSNGEEIESRTVIMAGGLEFKSMTFPGSEGPGVFVGDGKALAKAGAGGDVCVIGGSNGAAQAALGCAQKSGHVYLLARSPIVNSMSDYQVAALRNNPKVTVIEGDSIAKLVRDESGNPVAMETAKGQSLPIKALGEFIGSMPDTKWLPQDIPLKGGKVATNRDYETPIPGVYAVGDMRDGGAGRVGVAVGDGQFALRQANVFLDEQRKKYAESAAAAKADKKIKEKPDDSFITELFDLDRDNPWFGQTIEDVPPLKKKKDWPTQEQFFGMFARFRRDWDESKHPRVPAGGPGGGQFGSGGDGGGPEPLAEGDEPLLISERPGQEKLDLWNKQLTDRQEELNQAGQTGEHEDDQLNGMQLALSAYSQEDEKHLDEERAGLNVRYDLDNKLLAAAYADIIKKPQGDVAKIAYFGALDEQAHRTVLNDLTERWGNKVQSIQVQRWKDDPSLGVWEDAGFRLIDDKAGLSNLSAVLLEKVTGSTATAPDFEHLPVPVSVSEGTGTDFQSEVRSAFEAISPRALKTMAEGGITFKVGKRLTELNPELKGVHPRGWSPGTTWDSAEGMFSHAQKAVNVTEFYRPVGKKEFVRTSRARGVALHESGHAFDYALGRPSATSSAFIYAYTVDRKNMPKEARGPLRYFLQKGKNGRSEAFAETFAWATGEVGSGRTDLRLYFPRVAKLVKDAVDRGLWLEPVA